MFSREKLAQVNISAVLTIAWVLFTTLFFLFSVTYPFVVGKTQTVALQEAQVQGYNQAVAQAMQSFSGNAFQNGYGKAVVDLATALDAQFKNGCKEAVPVQIGTGALGIVSVNCIQQAVNATNNQPGQTPAPAPNPAPPAGK